MSKIGVVRNSDVFCATLQIVPKQDTSVKSVTVLVVKVILFQTVKVVLQIQLCMSLYQSLLGPISQNVSFVNFMAVALKPHVTGNKNRQMLGNNNIYIFSLYRIQHTRLPYKTSKKSLKS